MSLIIIGGHAGAGKTTCAHILSNKLGYPILDKATMTDPLATALYKQYGGEADMFSSPHYKEILALEYKCLMDSIEENLANKVSVIATAPWAHIFSDTDHTSFNEVEKLAISYDTPLTKIWIDASLTSMKTRLTERNNPRDSWKLDNWVEYCTGLSLAAPFQVADLVIYNSSGDPNSIENQLGTFEENIL